MAPISITTRRAAALVAAAVLEGLVGAARRGHRDLFAAVGQCAAALTVVGVLVPATALLTAFGPGAVAVLVAGWTLLAAASLRWCRLYWGSDRDVADRWLHRATLQRAGAGALRAAVGAQEPLDRIRRCAATRPSVGRGSVLAEAEEVARRLDGLLVEGIGAGLLEWDPGTGRLLATSGSTPEHATEAAALEQLVGERRHHLEGLAARLDAEQVGAMRFSTLLEAERELGLCGPTRATTPG